MFLAIFAIPWPVEAANNKTGDEKTAGPAYLLRYRFQQDEVLHYQVDHETSMTTTTPQHAEKVSTTAHSKKNHRVVDLDSKGNATLELMIESARMSAQFGDEKPKVFDSRNPKDCPPVYSHMKAIIGQPLARVQVSPRGELLATRPQLPHAVLAKANLVKKDGSLSNEAAQNFLIEFPEEALKIGAGWTNTFKVKVQVSPRLSQNVTFQRSYELTEVRGNLATIRMWTDLITPIGDGAILAQLIQMTPKAEIVFDLENGRIVSRTLTVDKTEVGVINGGGSMQAKSKRVERWIDPKAETGDASKDEKQAAR